MPYVLKREIQGLRVGFKDGKKAYWIDIYVNGKRITRFADFNKTKAKSKLEDIKSKARDSKFYDRPFEADKKNKILFETEAKDFLAKHSKFKKSGIRDEGMLRRHLIPYFKDKTLQEITPKMVEAYRNKRTEQGKAVATINREVALLKCLFFRAIRDDRAIKNPVIKGMIKKEENTIVRYLSTDDWKRLEMACQYKNERVDGVNYKSAPDYLYGIVLTAISTGMRKSEILNLKWQPDEDSSSSVDLVNGFIRLNKTKQKKCLDIKMNKPLTDLLKYDIKKPNTKYVFCDDNGKPLVNIGRAWKTALKRAGITNFRFHDLRHTYAVWLAMSGKVNIHEIRDYLGHSSITVTERYTRYFPEHSKTAVDVIEQRLNGMDKKMEALEKSETVSNVAVIENHCSY